MCRWASRSARGFAPVAGCCAAARSLRMASLNAHNVRGSIKSNVCLAHLWFRRSTAASVRRGKMNGILKSIGVSLGMACVTLLVLEMLLRICDFRELRDGADERALGYKHDAEIGWTPR